MDIVGSSTFLVGGLGEGVLGKGSRLVVCMSLVFLCACVVEMRSGVIPGNGLAGPSEGTVSSRVNSQSPREIKNEME